MDSKQVRRRKPAQRQQLEQKNLPKNHKKTSKCLLACCLFAAVCASVFVVGYLRSPLQCLDIRDLVYVPFEGKFEENRLLSKGKRIPGLIGAECIEEDKDGNLYTGLADGRILKVSKLQNRIGEGKTEVFSEGVFHGIAKTSDDIAHGRPLGFRIRNGVMYVMDAIYGFYTIDLTSKTVEHLVSPQDTEPPMKFPNDVDITSDGRIAYLTDTSTKHPITKLGYCLTEGCCTGRLFQYEFASKQLKTVVKDLCFANGVQLTRDETTLLVPETTRMRVRYLDVKTWRTKHVVHLPMMVDNVRLSNRGTFWVAGANVPGTLAKLLFRMPVLRQTLAGLLTHHQLVESMLYLIKTEHGVAVELNEHGEVLRVLQDPDGKLTFALSQLTELSDGRVALGSYFTSMSIGDAL